MAVLVREVTGRLYGVGMDYIPRRTASELPFESTDILLRYSFEHPALPFEFEDTLEVWSVGILQYHHEDGCPQCPPADMCRFHDGTPIGEMRFVKIRGFTADPAWEAADSHTGDIEKIVAVCTDPAYAMTPGLHWSPEFEERIDCPVGDLLIMDRVRIEPQWRGFGIGALAAAESIRRLAAGCCAVACEPAPTDGDYEDDEPGYQAAQAKIARVWESVGFQEFSNGIYLLDPAFQHPIDCRTSWQKHFGRQ
ncbi:hypothetical protein OG239_00610 [Streptomyces sp. NBC_00868]|uniref:hypothetical protein n=1 Tax=unclassified Streptomyces TaxID=2593676 RepID=UPI00325475D8|nr:hypothetical protein OG239_00610 [Streptomyces sp. NBC_00868]